MEYENRTQLLDDLPKQGVMAEVGVLAGNFSKYLLERCKPQILYLIDCWSERPRDEYADYKEGYITDAMCRYVVHRFRGSIAKGTVRPLAGMSWSVAKYVPDKSCDFIYIDGDHSYKGCLLDLKAYWPKVKVGGIMAGHDYDDIEWSKVPGKAFKRTDWGVISATNEFFGEGRVSVIQFPTPNWWCRKTGY